MESEDTFTPCQCINCKKPEPLAGIQEKPFVGSDLGSGFGTRKQIKYGSKYQAAWGIFSEYCDNSTIHGIKYLGERKRPLPERIFWICVFVLSLYICGSLLMTVWNKWTNNPVILVFEENLTPVYDIPFPTVTICMEKKSDPKTFHYSRTMSKVRSYRFTDVTPREQYFLEAIRQVCVLTKMNKFPYGMVFANASVLTEALEKAGPEWYDVVDVCYWRTNYSCEKYFHPVLTEEGVCYTINDLDPSDIYRNEVHNDKLSSSNYYNNEYKKTVDWDLENSYNLNANEETFPYRVFKGGNKVGMNMHVRFVDQERDVECRQKAEGLKIVLTTPGEIPQVSEQFIPIPISQAVMISIKPEIIRTSEGLRHYAPMRRRCYFQNERYLRYFKLYTQSNCRLECLTNYTLKHCGCVKFSMPKTIETPACGARKLACMNEAAERLSHEEIKRRLKPAQTEFRDEDDCNCLPSCTSITYNVEVSQTDIGTVEGIDVHPLLKYRYSSVSIYFKEAQFLTIKRSELYSKTDFIANCGGILGLLMGVSTLSIVELVYFCTVRMISNLKMRRRKREQRLHLEAGIISILDLTKV